MTLTEISKLLSYILRHKPEKFGVTLDLQGWAPIDTVLHAAKIDRPTLETIVVEDAKGRYSISEDGKSVRANQGHTKKSVHISFKTAVPPVTLWHGTTDDVWSQIQKHGLKPMSRHHVHLSDDKSTAEAVAGRRKSSTVVLAVDAKKMLADGIKFFISDNGVWLVDHVAPCYLTKETS